MNKESFDKEYYTKEIQKILDELEKSRSESIVFNEEKCDDITIGKTKIGGLPDLPSSVDYPVREEYKDKNGNVIPPLKMTLVCQINCEDVYPYDSDGYLPEKGMIYIFWSGDDKDLFQNKYGINTLRAFYWNGDMSSLIRKSADEKTEIYKESMITFSVQEEIYAEDIENRVENLLAELEDECNDYNIDYYNTEEYDILKSLPDKCKVSNSSKLFGYRAGVVYSGADFYNPFFQLDCSCMHRRGALWYLFIGVNGLRNAKNISGWTELETSLDYDMD